MEQLNREMRGGETEKELSRVRWTNFEHYLKTFPGVRNFWDIRTKKGWLVLAAVAVFARIYFMNDPLYVELKAD